MAFKMSIEANGVLFNECYCMLDKVGINNINKTCFGEMVFYSDANKENRIYPVCDRIFTDIPIEGGQDPRDVIYKFCLGLHVYSDAEEV